MDDWYDFSKQPTMEELLGIPPPTSREDPPNEWMQEVNRRIRNLSPNKILSVVKALIQNNYLSAAQELLKTPNVTSGASTSIKMPYGARRNSRPSYRSRYTRPRYNRYRTKTYRRRTYGPRTGSAKRSLASIIKKAISYA